MRPSCWKVIGYIFLVMMVLSLIGGMAKGDTGAWAFAGLIAACLAIYFGGLRISEYARSNSANRLRESGQEEYRRHEERKFTDLHTLEGIYALDPVQFERFIKSLFEKMGYTVETTPASGDEGIDLFLRKDGQLAIVQCKRYAGAVGQPAIRELYGVMIHTRARRAYLVTTGNFTPAAEAWAIKAPSLVLVDGAGLLEWVDAVAKPNTLLLPVL